MSERIYRWLLRLYPSRFRDACGADALQLYRDRSRDEHGIRARLRLWVDLLRDLAVSVPSEYRATGASLAVSPAGSSAGEASLFSSLRAETLSVRSLLFGGVASLVVCGSILSQLGSGRTHEMRAFGQFRPSPGSADTIPARPSAITVSFLPEKPVSGAVVRITVRVTSEDRPEPTGKVRIYDGVSVLSLSELEDGTVTITTRLPALGRHLIRATYLGDAYHDAVSSTLGKE